MKVEALEKKIEMTIPSEWEELSQNQFVETVDLLLLLIQKKILPIDFRIGLIKAFLQYKKPIFISQKRREIIDENLFFLSEYMRFPLKYIYSHELTDGLSQKATDKLSKYELIEIFDPQILAEIKHKQFYTKNTNGFWELNAHIEIDLDGLITLPIETLSIKQNNKTLTFKLPFFRYDKGSGLFFTNFTASQFVDMYECYFLYTQKSEPQILDFFCASAVSSSNETFLQNSKFIALAEPKYKYAILIWFQAFLKFIMSQTDYHILFAREKKETTKESLNMGLGETILFLSKIGYGSKDEIAKTNVIDFFDMLLKETKDNINQLREIGIEENEISTKIGIPYEILQKI